AFKIYICVMGQFKNLTFLFCLLFGSQVAFSQHADCGKLLLVKDSVYNAKNIVGFGQKQELSGKSLESKYSFEEEKNSIWYLLEMPTSGKFTFKIVGETPQDDWDFLLFKQKDLFCKRIDANKIKPIRSNLSRSKTTGLSLDEEKEFYTSGIQHNYSKYVEVIKGDKYVLVVNNPKRAGGSHQLILNFPKKEVVVALVIPFALSVKDKATSQKVPSIVNISGIKRKPLELRSVVDYETTLHKKRYKLTVDVSAPGYMLQSIELPIKKSSKKENVEVLLENVAVGLRVNLKNILFYPGKSEFVPTAKGSVTALFNFLEQNPIIVIEIEGHVNGPYSRNRKEFQELSSSRAEAIKRYLIKKGIDSNRIFAKGYGNLNMLFPDPKTKRQHAANRRVEVVIKSIK
ncbi:OmpA family protein, partial [bacterium]|nr:OmpA family protein [bacterium]